MKERGPGRIMEERLRKQYMPGPLDENFRPAYGVLVFEKLNYNFSSLVAAVVRSIIQP